MTTPGGLQVVGGRELRRAFDRAGVDVQDLKDAHRAVAELVKDAADPRTPRRTGRLANSTRAAGTKSAAIVRAGGARVPYANPIHWGWPARHIAAQPWVSEAAEDTEPRWADEYMAALDAVIQAIEGAP